MNALIIATLVTLAYSLFAWWVCLAPERTREDFEYNIDYNMYLFAESVFKGMMGASIPILWVIVYFVAAV